MGGHLHPLYRCDTCKFWARGDQFPFREDLPPDEQTAACRRHAPRPSLGAFEYQVLNLLSILTWHAGNVGDDNEREHGDWEEANLANVSWPGTAGDDWCGEWESRHDSA